MSTHTSRVNSSGKPASVSPTGHHFFGLNALAAWLGLATAFVLSILGVYPNTNLDPTLLGFNADGADGLIGRVSDSLSYFTHWSNLVVAIVMTMLWRNSNRTSKVFSVLRFDALIMITITGLVYALILAPVDKLQGWQYVSNALEHYLTPLLTIAVFIFFGPRGQVRLRLIPLALILPLIWVAVALIRGSIIGAYPYGFINVATWGYGTVAINLLGIVIFGSGLGALYCGIESWMTQRTKNVATATTTE